MATDLRIIQDREGDAIFFGGCSSVKRSLCRMLLLCMGCMLERVVQFLLSFALVMGGVYEGIRNERKGEKTLFRLTLRIDSRAL